MKNAKRNTIIVLLITIVVLFFVLKDDYKNILNTLIIANKWYILIGIILIICYWALRALCLLFIVRKYKKNVGFKKMLHQTVITQFFNGITPFSTGGQPMQIYMLNKLGIRVTHATNIIVQDFIMYQLALIVMGILALFANWYFHFFDVSNILKNLIIIGFLINIIIGLCLILISFSKKFNSFIGKIIIKIAAKTKIVKDGDSLIAKWEDKLSEFHESGKLFKKEKKLFIVCFLCHLVSLLIFYSIPLFIFLSLDSTLSLNLLKTITSSAFVLIIGNFVPIPGGSGGIEYGFISFFGSDVGSTILLSALIVWRFITYYLGIIVGGISLGFFKGEKEEICE